MKKIFTFLLVFVSFAAAAQLSPESREQKVEALYVAYITKELQLTETEAQKFWPIHQQYDNEIKAAAQGGDVLAQQQSQLNVKKKYQERFTKVLGAERTNSFFVKDGEFRKKLIDRLRKMRQNNQGLRRPGLGQRSIPEN